PIQPKGEPEGPKAPRLPIIVQPLPDLGAVLIRAYNEQDLKDILLIIDLIVKEAAKTEIQIKYIPLQVADAASVATQLNTLYSRVVISPQATIVTVPKTGGVGGVGAGALGVAAPGAAASTIVIQP